MNEEAELAKAKRASLRVLPAYAVMTVLSAALVYTVPRWWSWIILAVTAFTLVGDLLNVIYASGKLARRER